MKFSVVIPVYNTEQYLPRCLDSLKAQTDSDFEVIVVDDCSPGPCEATVRPYGDFVRYIRHERNRSAFQARCTGVSAARGDYVVPVDPDDYLVPETLARVHATIGRDGADIVSYWMDYDDGKRVYPHWCRHPAAVVSGPAALEELVDNAYFTGVASKVFRRELLGEVIAALAAPDVYINTSDDFLMLVPSLVLCKVFSFLDFAGYRYFVNRNSTSFSWKTNEGLRKACVETRQVLDLVCRAASTLSRDESALRNVKAAADMLECWFVDLAVDGGTAALRDRIRIVQEQFHAENVAEALAEKLVSIRSSRSYRVSEALSGNIKRILGR